ncbi:hypothetical protein CDAR_103431, partial [Caerostris darwini]
LYDIDPEAYEHNRTTHSSSPPTPTPIHPLLSNPNPANNFRIAMKSRKHRNNGPRTPDGLRASHPEDSKGHCSTFDCHPENKKHSHNF